ncbi:hypothetical protein GMST_28100 [Geomonas silvestris]|uniref:Lipoprotein n=1 Tax=Geomonas silvestris TaxID=2740184 RepID=A0A6V8MKD1_9BACT|nr:hypothetical protein [Geomonas silvestris]GFO60485.1 hypothetical protein GMST_28100 [Geomonas silvestris]
MKKLIGAIVVLVLCCASAFAQGGLDSFLKNLNIQARADLNGFSAKVGVQFGVPQAQVQAVIGTVREPADAFMVFQLGQLAHQPADSVVQVYQTNRGKGWGVIAKNLGIKPGSAEFHRLKRGDFALTGDPGSADNPGKGHGKGKGKGHNK